jgi:hypothetical protein
VREAPEAILIETGAAVFHLGRSTLQPFGRVVLGGADIVDPVLSRIVLRDPHGREGMSAIEQITLEAGGPVRATIRAEGTFTGSVQARFVARLCFFSGTGLVRLRLTLHNPGRARHRGGLWDLGDPWSVYFDSLSLHLALRGSRPAQVVWQAEPDQAPCVLQGSSLSLLQASSGGENWQSPVHVNHRGRITLPFRGYRVQHGHGECSGRRASPVVSLRGERAALTVAVPEFWQQFPKGLRVTGNELVVDLFPHHAGERHELQGGEQKTHTVWLHFGQATGAGWPMGWVHRPALVQAARPWHASTGAVPFLPAALEPGPAGRRCERLLTEALEGPDSFFAKRERIDEYGWRHFGETYADHENEHYPGPKPVVSHYNNQYDLLNGLLLNYFRTGDVRWWQLADPLARHVIDIDIYHTDRDRPAYNGGLFWHTDHYRDASTSTHRAYSKGNRRPGQPYGGGPGNEHNYTTGLLHYYYHTGDPLAREAVLSLANWVVTRDDGTRTLLGLIDDGPTGLSSRTGGDGTFHGPGRGSGNSINALLDAWLLTGDESFLDKAEELVCRCIHPADDLDAMDLGNPEHRWSYTVFLSVLARYLHLKLEAGRVDEKYSYARAALVHYGEWMAAHERPYFDQVERLEFPNETWAAQEMRKANVLRLAARHADEPGRSAMCKRGAELAGRAWHDVFGFPTRTSTRSLAILLTEGLRDSYLVIHAREAVTGQGPPADSGQPLRFVPQRWRVREQLKTASGWLRALVRMMDVRRWPRALRARQM